MQLKQLRQIATKSKGLSKKKNFRTNLVHNITTKKLNLTSQSFSSFNKTQKLKANHTLPSFQKKSFTPKYNRFVQQFRKFSSGAEPGIKKRIDEEKRKQTPFVSIEQRLKERKTVPIHEVYDKFSDIEFSRHKTKVGFNHSEGTDESPFKIVNNAFIAPCATLVGNVEIADQSSIWFGSIIRADRNLIRIGGWSNIQDNCYISELGYEIDQNHDGSVIIGSYVTIGHSSVLVGCTLESETLVGIGCVVEPGSWIEKNSILGAGSRLEKNMRIPAGQLWVGDPAVYVRDLKDSEIDDIKRNAQKYRDLSWTYVEHFIPFMGASKEADEKGYNVGWKERGYGWKELGYKESDYLREKDL